MSPRGSLWIAGLAVTVALLSTWPHLVRAREASSMRTVCGHVCDPRGNPIADATVTLLLPGGPGAPGAAVALCREWSDGYGWFELTTSTRGPLRLDASAGGFTATSLPVTAGEFRVVLDPEAAIDGRVLDVEGAPVPSVQLLAVDVEDPARSCSTWSRWDGSFRLRVPPGRRFRIEGETAEGQRVDSLANVAGGGPRVELRLPR